MADDGACQKAEVVTTPLSVWCPRASRNGRSQLEGPTAGTQWLTTTNRTSSSSAGTTG